MAIAEYLDIAEVVVDNDLYPRANFDNDVVNTYAMNLDALPPIVISNEKVLIDGYHRLLAHKLSKRTVIKAEVLDVPRDRILWEATRLNAKHGFQLRKDDKKRLSRIFYKNNGCTLSQIAEVLAVSESTLSNWLKDVIQESKEEQRQQVIDLYLQCLTYEQISEKLGISVGTISNIFNKFKSELSENPIIPESLQLFNVWNFAERERKYGLDFQGAIPGQIVENVLYYYTEPFDVVVDPMAGGGTTIDVCKSMYRRYRAYDIEPVREDILRYDISKGYPQEAKNADVIFLDPPYYNMVFKDLFKDIEDFYKFLHSLARDTYTALSDKGYVAFLIQDMTELGNYCLSGEAYRTFRLHNFVCEAHISTPLSTQQFLPQQVESAKENRHILGRNRDLYIFKKTGDRKLGA